MSSLLTPDFGLLFWMVINFTIVFVLLARFGFPVITKSVNKRSDYIQNSLKVADEANQKLASVRLEAEEMTNQARVQQAEIIKKAMSDGDGIVRNAQDKAAAESEKQLLATRSQIAAQKEKAMAEISSQIAMMAVSIAEQILRKQLDDPQKQEELILKMLDEADNLDKKHIN